MFNPFKNMQDASFRGVPFLCQSASDSAGRALAVHEYPIRDGGELDDMGRNARRYQIRAIFYGNGYQGRTDRFTAALDQGGEGELVHPVYGALAVMVESYTVEHDAENPDSCTVQAVFVESGPENSFFAEAGSIGGMAARFSGRVNAAVQQAASAAAAAFQGVAGTVAASVPGGVASGISGALWGMAGVYKSTAATADLTLDYLKYPSAWLASVRGGAAAITTPAAGQGLFPTWKRASGNLPGVSLATGKPVRMYTGRDRLSMPETGGIRPDVAPGGMFAKTRSVPAAPLAFAAPQTLALAQPDAAPEEAATEPGPLLDGLGSLEAPHNLAVASAALALNLEQTRLLAEAAVEILLDEAETPSLSPREVEAIVADTRERLQDGIEGARAVLPAGRSLPVAGPLRDAALAVQELGAAVLRAKPSLHVTPADGKGNHHLLAHMLYKDYRRSTELLRLNPSVRRPNRLARGTPVVHYRPE